LAYSGYKGITVKFGADTTEMGKALKQVDTKAKETQANLKSINNALKFDKGNTTLLSEQFKTLGKRIDETKQRLKLLTDAKKAQEAAFKSGKISADDYQAFQTEVAKTERDLKSLQKQAEQTAGKLTSQLKGAFDDVKTSVTKFAKIIAAGETALIGLSTKAVQTGMTFESAMSQVGATMGIQTTSEDFQKLSDAAKEMGATTSFFASEAADALNYLALAGYDAEKAIATLPKTLTLAKAGGMDLATASDMMTDAMSALGLSTEEVDNFINEMAKTSQKSNTNVAQLGEATLTCAGAVSTTGQSLETMNTALGVLANNGLKSAEGGTHLRNILISLANPTSAATKELEQLGVQVTDNEGNIRDLNDIMTDLNNTLSQSNGERTKQLGSIFNKTDLNAVNALLKATGGTFEQLKGQISDANGAADEMAKTMADNLQGDLVTLKSQLEAVQIAISEKLTPSLRNVAKHANGALKDVLDRIENGDLSDTFKKLGESIDKFLTKGIDTIAQILPSIVKFLTEIMDHMQAIVNIFITLKVVEFNTKIAKSIINLCDNLKNFKTELDAVNAAGKSFSASTMIKGFTGVASVALSTSIALKTYIDSATAAMTVIPDKYEGMNEEQRKLLDSVDETISKVNEETESFNKNIEELNNQSTAINDTKDKLIELTEQKKKSAEDNEQILTYISELNQQIPDLNLAYDENTGKLNMNNAELEKAIQNYADLAMKQELASRVGTFKADNVGLKSQLEELQAQRDEYDKTIDDINQKAQEIIETIGSTNKADTLKIEDLNSQLKTLKEQLDSVNNASAENYAALDEVKSALSNNSKQIADYEKEIGKVTTATKSDTAAKKEDASATEDLDNKMSDLSNKTNTATSEMSELSSVLEKLTQNQSLSTDQVLTLITKYPELATAVKSTADGYKIEESALRSLINARAENLKVLAEEQEKTRLNSLQKSMVTKLENLGVVDFEAENMASVYMSQGENGTFNASNMKISNKKVRQAVIDYINSINQIKEQTEAQKKIADDIIKNGYKSGSSSTSNSSSSSNKTTSTSSKNTTSNKNTTTTTSNKKTSTNTSNSETKAQKELDLLQKKYNALMLSDEEYQKQYKALYKKYNGTSQFTSDELWTMYAQIRKWNKEAEEKAQEEAQAKKEAAEAKERENIQKQIDALKEKYDLGKIGAIEYYNELQKLNDKYYKGKTKYAEEYAELEKEIQAGLRQAQEDNINNVMNLYEKTNDVIEAQAKLNGANKKQKLYYSSERGFYLDKDVSAVSEAQSNLYNAQKSLMQQSIDMGGNVTTTELSRILSNLPNFNGVTLPTTNSTSNKTVTNSFVFTGDIKTDNPQDFLKQLNSYIKQAGLDKMIGK
jgi:TP901 family phage tail tape measure protein